MADAGDSKSPGAKVPWGFKSLRRHHSPLSRIPFAKALFATACLWLVLSLGPRLGSPWAWDDLTVIAYNQSLRGPGALGALVTPRYFQLAPRELSWRPASTLLHVLGLKAFGLEPFGHRAVELGMHLLAAFLLALGMRRWGIGEDAAWLAAAAFAAHPVHLETLFCVSFNEEILVLLGLLAAWLCRMRWAQSHRGGWLAGSVAGFALALLAKETGALVMPILWLLERLGPRRRDAPPASWAPYAGVALLYLLVRFVLLRGPGEGGGFPVAPPFLYRFYFAGTALWDAMRLSVLPWPLRIEYFAVPPVSLAEIVASAAGWAVVGGLGAAWWTGRGQRPDSPSAWPGAFWALLALAPALNLVAAYSLTTRYFAERWTYVPLAGLCLAGAALASHLSLRSRGARAGAAAALAGLAALGALQSPLWSDDVRLWARLADVYPWSAKAHEGLGEALYRRGRYAEALASLRLGLRFRLERSDRVLAFYVPLFESRRMAMDAGSRPPAPPLQWESATSRLWLARAWMAVGRPDAAREHLRRAEELSAGGL